MIMRVVENEFQLDKESDEHDFGQGKKGQQNQDQ